MRRHFFALFGALLISVAVLAPAEPALARTVVARADPPDSSVLAQPPQQVHLWLNESVVVDSVKVTLIDTDGHAIAIKDVTTEPYRPNQEGLEGNFDPTYLYMCSVGKRFWPSVLTVTVPPLRDGSYALAWQTTSLEQQQLSSGRLVFGVRQSAQNLAAAFPAVSVAADAQQHDDLLISLAVQPNVPGQNFLTLGIASTRRPIVAPIEHVAVRITPADGHGDTAMLVAAPLDDSHYQVTSNRLTAGAWHLDVIVSRPGQADTVATFAWDVQAPSLVNSKLMAIAAQTAPVLALCIFAAFAIVMLMKYARRVVLVAARFRRAGR